MKKIFFFASLLFQLTMGFGQYGPNKDCAESGCGGNNAIIRCWGNPKTFPEFPGIVVRVKGPIEQCFNGINDEPNRHSYRWVIELKGSTNSLFRVDAVDGNGKTISLGGGTDGECIYPSEITQKDIQAANDSRIRNNGEILDLQTFSNAENINIQLIKCVSSFQVSSNAKSNTTAQKQNDLTEYNRSKAEMERKIDEKNAQLQQDANNSYQSYKQAFDAGVSAYNNNNYTEAQRQFQLAMNASTTEEQRRGAKDNYDKAVNAPRRQATGELVKVGVNVLQELFRKDTYEERQEKRQEREQERFAQEQLDKEKEKKAAEVIEMERQWKLAQDYSELKSTEGYEKAIALMIPYADNRKLNGGALNDIGFWYWKLNNFENALIYYKKAFKKDYNMNAVVNIGVLYLNGSGIEKDGGKAMDYFLTACGQKFEGGCKAYKTARDMLELQIEKNKKKVTLNESYFIGLSYLREDNYKKVESFFTQAYELDTTSNWSIPLVLANLYSSSLKLNNKELAIKWYLITIKMMENYPQAKLDITEGELFPTDHQNHFFGRYSEALSGLSYLDGKSAIEAYLKSTKLDKRTIGYGVGQIYKSGAENIEADWGKAMMYFEQGAEDKYASKCMSALGELYESGGPNLKKNIKESKKWFKKACLVDRTYCR